MIVAVDGPAGAGKGTLARRLAASLDFAYLDTGSIYRAVAARLLAEGGDPLDAEAAAAVAERLSPGDLEREDLRDEATSQAASQVASYPGVRRALLAFQRDFAAHPPAEKAGAILDGRDIGTVICPGAEAKIFVTASLEERARRRHKELLDRGEESIYARVQDEMAARDKRDSERAEAPLKPAEDAFVLDTTDLDIDAAYAAALSYLRSRMEPREPQ